MEGGIHMIKNFDDFLKTINEETLINIANNVNSIKAPVDIEGYSAINSAFTFEILRLYHEWIQAQV